MKDILIFFDDDYANLNIYEKYFGEVYQCEKFMNPFHYEKALEFNPSAIIIDVNMPILDGPGLYKKILNDHKYNGCPILFISSNDSDETLMEALRLGGQDFLNRRMSKEEMLLRVGNKVDYYNQNKSIYTLGEVRLDIKNLKVYEKEKTVDLTLTEMKLLRTLLAHYPKQLTREEINALVWPGQIVQSNTLNTHLCNLRGKFSEWSYEILHIKNQGILVAKKHNSGLI